MLASAALLLLLLGLEWEGSRARWLRELASGDEGRRVDALHGLAALTGSEVDAAISSALADDSEDVRLEAALACEARALRACAGPLAEWLGDADPDVRAIAARALGHTGSDADAPRLARMLGDARPQVRRAAVLGLGALGGAAAVPPLVSALADADPIVRERAVTALGEIASDAGERSAASSALLSLTRDEAPEVRVAALDALGMLGDARAGASAMVALDDDVIEVRLAAMRALTLVPSTAATPALIRASADEDREGRAALAALARAQGGAALDAIVAALLRSPVARSAEDALEVRMQVDEASRVEVVAALAHAIESAPSADRVARLAASASRLSLHGSTAGLETALESALRSGAGAAVLEALGRTGADQALVPILDALASEDASTRSAALSGLEGFAATHEPDGRILDPLSVAFLRLDPDEQARAVAIVGRARSERASDWLVARLDDGSRAARVAALRALRVRAPASATDRLVALLEDPDAEVRGRAALALAELATQGGVSGAAMAQLSGWLAAVAPHDRPAILLALGPMLRAAPVGADRARAREAMLAAFDSADAELADSAAFAIAASHDASLMLAVLARGVSSGPALTTRVLRALSGAELDAARAFAVAHLDAADPEIATAAYTTLAAIGGAPELDAIVTRVTTLRFPVNAAAAFALARMARRGVPSGGIGPALASLSTSHDPYVRANVALAAAYLRLPRIDGGPTALDWLTGTAPIVRAAAARWGSAVRDQVDPARVATLLAVCAHDPAQPALARACASPALETSEEDADLVAIDTASRAMPGRLIALRLADGSALVTYTDARGRVRLESAPSGPLSLDAPESAVLVP